MAFENLNFFKLKKDKEAPQQVAEEVDDSNDVTKMRSKEPAVKGLKGKYIYCGVGALILIMLLAFSFGMADDSSQSSNKQAATDLELKNSQAVEGNHLFNIPKDYKEQAEAEAKRKAEQEAKEALEKKTQETQKNTESTPEPPAVPQQPVRYTGRNELSPAEKARLAREERRLEAMQSPIGFEIKH